MAAPVSVSDLLSRAREADRRAKELKRQAAIYVLMARRAGATWAEVGAAFGITRQSAHQRFAKHLERDQRGQPVALRPR